MVKGLGAIGISLEVIGASITIAEAWDTDRRMRTVFEETGKSAGGALIGSVSAYLVCSVGLSLPSISSSFLFCGMIVGGLGGYTGALAGEEAGHYLSQFFE